MKQAIDVRKLYHPHRRLPTSKTPSPAYLTGARSGIGPLYSVESRVGSLPSSVYRISGRHTGQINPKIAISSDAWYIPELTVTYRP